MSGASVTVLNPAWVEDRGASSPDWSDPTQTDEAWSNIQPLSASEATDLGRQGVVTMLRGIGPVDTALTAQSRAVIDGITYEVVSVQRWQSITGYLAHSEAVFERVEG